MNMSLTDHVFGAVYDIIDEMFVAPERELVMWVEKNAKAFQHMNVWYTSPNPPYTLDTREREEVYDVIAKYFTMQPWPRYGAGDLSYEQFIDKLKHSIIKYGWELKSS